MKMYEKMGIDPMKEEGLKKIMGLFCEDIPDVFGEEKRRSDKCLNGFFSCDECKAKRLFAEVPTKKVKRWKTIKSNEDVVKLLKEFKEFCGELESCHDCLLNNAEESKAGCFTKYLCEEIEVEE